MTDPITSNTHFLQEVLQFHSINPHPPFEMYNFKVASISMQSRWTNFFTVLRRQLNSCSISALVHQSQKTTVQNVYQMLLEDPQNSRRECTHFQSLKQLTTEILLKSHNLSLKIQVDLLLYHNKSFHFLNILSQLTTNYQTFSLKSE